MATSTIVWIVVAVIAAVVVIGALAWLARNQRDRRRITKSDEIREQVRQDSVDVERREALARETAARARAAEAEAEAKAAEAERLKGNADRHLSHATEARSELDERRSHADALDPRVTDTENGDRTTDSVRRERSAG